MSATIQYKFAGRSISKYLEMRNIAFYLFAYHMVLSGIFAYLEYIGRLAYIPFRTVVLFGIPFIFYCIIYLLQLFTKRKSRFYYYRTGLFFTIIGYLLGVILLNTSTFDFSTEVTTYNLTAVAWFLVAFIMGSNLTIKEAYHKTIVNLYAFFVLIVLINIDPGTQRLIVPYDQLGIFHFLGDSFAIWSLLTIAIYKDKMAAAVVFVISVGCLFLISSRTSLYAFVFILPFIFKKNRNGIFRFLFFSMILGGIALVIVNFEALMDTRMLRFFFTGYDHSFYMREKILIENSKDLIQNWFFGDYAGQLRHGDFGLYIHNYLSMWRQFGIIPFLIFLALLMPFFRWFIAWFRGVKYQQHDFLFYLIIFSLIEVIFARSYKYHFIWIALGMITQIAITNIRDKQNATNSLVE